jgi:hypothetical protein
LEALKQFFVSKARVTGILAATIGVLVAGRIILKFYSGQQTITITGIEILGLIFSVIIAVILLNVKAGKPERSKDVIPD